MGKPWFAIGGLDAGNVHEVVERGATRIVVVRAITEADDPEAAARELRAALEGGRADAELARRGARGDADGRRTPRATPRWRAGTRARAPRPRRSGRS